MKQIGSQRRETLKESGYKLVGRPHKGAVILQDILTGQHELWQANDDHAGYTIQVGRWGYEFVRSVKSVVKLKEEFVKLLETTKEELKRKP